MAIFFSPPVLAADLRVTVEGLRNDVGFLRLAFFDQAKEFPHGKQVRGKDVSAKTGDMVLVFKNMSPGFYALAIHHDENTNKEMDTNFIGLPKEGYGFSNNARVIFGPPTFEAATFEISKGPAAISLRLAY